MQCCIAEVKICSTHLNFILGEVQVISKSSPVSSSRVVHIQFHRQSSLRPDPHKLEWDLVQIWLGHPAILTITNIQANLLEQEGQKVGVKIRKQKFTTALKSCQKTPKLWHCVVQSHRVDLVPVVTSIQKR